MPDMDVVERSLTRPWRSVFRLIKGQQPSTVVCKGILEALTLQLQSDGGVPALAVTGEAVARATGIGEQDRSFPEVLRQIERSFSQQRPVKSTVEAAQRLLAKIEAGRLYQRYVEEWSHFPVASSELAFAA